MLDGAFIGRRDLPGLISGYASYCRDNGIEVAPFIRYRADTIAHCSASGDIYVGDRFFQLPLEKQLDALAHETYHAIEFKLKIQEKLERTRERKADKFAALTRSRECSIGAAMSLDVFMSRYSSLLSHINEEKQAELDSLKVSYKQGVVSDDQLNLAIDRTKHEQFIHGSTEERIHSISRTKPERLAWADQLIEQYNALSNNGRQRF